MRVSFTVAGYPVGKGRPRTRVVATKDGRHFATNYTPAATRNYEAAVRMAAQAAMGGRAPFAGPVRIALVSVFAIPQSWSLKRHAAALAGIERPTVKPDWDNIAKITDALNGVVFLDDKQIVDGRVAKWYGPAPMFEVTVIELDERTLRGAAAAPEQELPL